MARFLTVNDFSGSPPVPRGNQDFNLDPEEAAADSEVGVEPDSYGVETASHGSSTATSKNRNDQGPCLYFGPQGQRCSRPAIANGFCARHMPAQLGQAVRSGGETSTRPGAAALGSRPLARIVAVGIAIFAALWPVVADLLREIIRWIHAH